LVKIIYFQQQVPPFWCPCLGWTFELSNSRPWTLATKNPSYQWSV